MGLELGLLGLENLLLGVRAEEALMGIQSLFVTVEMRLVELHLGQSELLLVLLEVSCPRKVVLPTQLQWGTC